MVGKHFYACLSTPQSPVKVTSVTTMEVMDVVDLDLLLYFLTCGSIEVIALE